MKKIILACCLILLSTFQPVNAFSSDGGFDLQVSRPELKLKANFLGQEIDITEKAGVMKGDSVQSSLFINDRVRLSYADFSYEGQKQFFSKIKLNNDLTSQWNLTYGGIGYLMPIDSPFGVDMHMIFDVKGYEIQSNMQAHLMENEVLNQEIFNLRGIAPTLGFGVTKNIQDKVQVYGEVMGLPLGDLGTYFDLDTGIKIKMNDIAMNLGYRSVHIESAYYSMKNFFDAKFQGPYFGLSYAF